MNDPLPDNAQEGGGNTSIFQLLKLLLLIIAVVVVVGSAFWIFAIGFRVPDFNSRQTGNTERLAIVEIAELTRAGDFQAARNKNLAIQADENIPARDKALAEISTFGSEFRLTGDLSDRIADIQNMKDIVRDETLPEWIRANALNLVAGQYGISGAETAVFNEIFSDAPFNRYLVEGKPTLSVRGLFEWSYQMSPTSYAAISIAKWYSEQQFSDTTLSESEIKQNFVNAEEYLKRAEVAAVQEQTIDPAFQNSGRYVLYRYWRAVVVGRLAVQNIDPYTSQYRTEYESFIEFANASTHAIAKEYLPYARLFYSGQLSRLGDREAAKMQADLLAAELKPIADLPTNVFATFLKNAFANNDLGTQRLIRNVGRYSPDFKVVAEEIVGRPLE